MLTENDIKEELSFAYVHAMATKAGYSFERVTKDRDSIDVRISAKGKVTASSIYYSPQLEIQLKATSQQISDGGIPFPLPIKNYEELRKNTLIPRLVILLILPENSEEWIYWNPEELIFRGQAYWMSLSGYEFSDNETTKTIYFPRENRFDSLSLQKLMDFASKRETFGNESTRDKLHSVSAIS